MANFHNGHQLRRTKQLRKFSKKQIRLIDKTILVLGVLNLFATMPQILSIWLGRNAAGVSTITWTYYAIFALLLFVYGYAHNEKPIMALYGIGSGMYCIIAVGSFIY